MPDDLEVEEVVKESKNRKIIPFIFILIVIPLTTVLALAQQNFFSRASELAVNEAPAVTTREPLVMGMSLPESLASKDGRETQTLAAIDAIAKPVAQGGVGYYPGTFSIWTDFNEPPGEFAPRASFPSTALLKGLDDRNITPVIFMEPVGPGIRRSDGDINEAMKYSNNSIVNGSFDTFLIAWAQGAKAYGKPVILRYAQEMNGNWFPWSVGQPAPKDKDGKYVYYNLGNTKANYISAWRHIYNTIHPIAPNVKFYWCPFQLFDTNSFSFFPGVSYVDYIGFNAYQWNGNSGGTMKNLYGPSINFLRGLPGLPKNADGTSKIPIIIGETGIASSPRSTTTYRKTWLGDGYRNIYSQFHDVRAILYFNFDMTNLFGRVAQQVNWDLKASPEIRTTYAGLASDPKFQGNFKPMPRPTLTPTPTPTKTPTPTPTSIPTHLPSPTFTPTPTPTTANPLYDGYLDQASCSIIYGWAANKNRLNTPINVDIYSDGVFLTNATANEKRSDVGAYLGDGGMHGFSISTPTSLKNNASHTITVKYGGTNKLLHTNSKKITCTP